jgi:N-ATPase, AtpR subunit
MSRAHLHTLLPIATAFAGCALGLLYFAILRHTVAVLSRGGGGGAATALTLGRLGLAVTFFLLVARLDALALLAALGGFLSARMLAVRAAHRTR